MTPVDLVAVGDVSFGDHYACASIGLNSFLRSNSGIDFFGAVKAKLRCGHVTFGNLETVLSEYGLNRRSLHSMHMRGHPSCVNSLVSAGFSVLNVANNHMLQHGERAFHDTVDILKQNDIGVVGIACPDGRHCVRYITEIARTECIFLGYGFEQDKYYSGTTLYAQGHEESVLEDIRSCKGRNNLVICSFHWGKEFVSYPSIDQIRLGRRAIDAGCDLILGHHPHVLNGYEYWRQGLILYSMGNLLFDQVWNPSCREGCIAHIKLKELQFQLAQAWRTEIGNDFLISCDSDEQVGRTLFEKLNEQILKAVETEGKQYEQDQRRADRINRHRSWAYLARNVMRYDPLILKQIVQDTLSKKLRRNVVTY